MSCDGKPCFKSANELHDYVLDLSRDGHHTLGKFQAAFVEMTWFSLTAKQTSDILHKAALYIGELRACNDPIEHELTGVVRCNLPFWRALALKKMQPQTGGNFTTWDLANVLWAHARLDLDPGPEFVSAWLNMAVPLLARGKFTMLELTSSLWAFASLGINPGKIFMGEWISQAGARLVKGDFQQNSQGMINCAWALTVLHAISPCMKAQALARNLLVAYQKRIFNDDGYGQEAQSAQVQAYFQYRGLANENYTETNTRSRGETLLAAAFRRFASPPVTICDKTFIPSLSHRPDIVLRDGTQQVIVEYDGPHHFTGRNFNGGTILMSRLMEKHCADAVVVRLPYWVKEEWGAEPQSFRDRLQGFVTGSFQQTAGAYTFDNSQGFQPLFVDNNRGEREYAYTAWRLAA